MSWFRRARRNAPERDFRPADVALPFDLPVIVLADDGGVSAYRRPDGLILVSEQRLSKGGGPPMRVVAANLRVWQPVEVVAVSDAQKAVFGQRLFFAELKFEERPPIELEAIRSALCLAIERDPDDLWNQLTSRDALLEGVVEARTFEELVHVIIDLGCQGG